MAWTVGNLTMQVKQLEDEIEHLENNLEDAERKIVELEQQVMDVWNMWWERRNGDRESKRSARLVLPGRCNEKVPRDDSCSTRTGVHTKQIVQLITTVDKGETDGDE